MDNMREETIAMILKIYGLSPCGGALHIVLDDGNTEDCHITWCLMHSIPEIEDESERTLYAQCAVNLIKMGTERKRDSCICEAFGRLRNLRRME